MRPRPLEYRLVDGSVYAKLPEGNRARGGGSDGDDPSAQFEAGRAGRASSELSSPARPATSLEVGRGLLAGTMLLGFFVGGGRDGIQEPASPDLFAWVVYALAVAVLIFVWRRVAR